MTRIMVVDDHEIVRDALAGLLGETPGLEVVGVASSIREAVPMLERSAPDLVLADLSLGDGSATELVRALRRARLKGRVVIITGFNDEFAAAEALAAGASGYVLKSQSTSELLEAIRTVASGRQYVAPLIATRLSGRLGDGEGTGEQEGSLGLERLSRRELEIFRLVVAGYPSKEVARRLCISVKTVETHRTNMNRKLAVRTTADLIRFAVAHGIVVAPRVFPEDVIDASHAPPPEPIKEPAVVIPVDYGDAGAPTVRPRS